MADRLTGLAFVIFGMLVAAGAVGLGVADWRAPGPGFLPLLVGVAASLLGAGLALSRTPQGFRGDLQHSRRRTLLAAGVLLGGYALALGHLGFVPATFVLIVVWLRVVGRSPWREAALVAAAGTTAMYTIFVRWLAIPLPGGILAP